MRRELSSDTTLLYKFVLPGVFILASVFVLFIFIYLIASGQGFPYAMLWFMFIWPWVVGFWCYTVIPLKKVSLDGYSGRLYVSNYRREIIVPVSEIEDAQATDQYRGFSTITLSLKTPTVFGRKIKFVPYSEWRGFWGQKEHSLVGELKRLAQTQDFDAQSPHGAG
jgi:hypothetical protein